MDLVPASIDDRHFLREMTLMAAFPPGDVPGTAAEMPHARRWWTTWGRDGDIGVIARIDGVPVGAAWCRRQEHVLARDADGDPLPEVAIAVEPRYRSRGIGRAMLSDLERLAAAAGYAGLTLIVNERNPALRLYGRSGYEVTRRDRDRIVMVKSFDGHATSR